MKFGVVEVIFDHVPRPVKVEPEILSTESLDQETIAIDGFEFTSRVSSESADETNPMPDETIKIETLKADKNETEPGK